MSNRLLRHSHPEHANAGRAHARRPTERQHTARRADWTLGHGARHRRHCGLMKYYARAFGCPQRRGVIADVSLDEFDPVGDRR